MDMLPPQAPPALVSHANQAAVDALRRLADTQQWLLRQQNAFPSSPSGDDGRAAFLLEVDAFWNAPADQASSHPARSRRDVFARKLAQAAYDDASLRANDGTLSDEAFELVRSVAQHPDTPLPSHLHADELHIADATYAGALVLRDDRHPDRALLFTAREGWESFGSLATLLDAAESRLRRELAATNASRGVDAGTVQANVARRLLRTREIPGQPFEAMAERLVERFRERLREVLRHASTLSPGTREDALRTAADLQGLLDVHGMVESRDADLLARAHHERMARVPDDVRRHWENAAHAYRAALRDAASARHDRSTGEPLSLVAFADRLLRDRLRVRGIDADPADILVRLSGLPASPSDLLAGAAGALPADTLSLSRLAFRHLAPTDLVAVLDAEGSPRTGLTPATIRELVADIDLPNAYADHLDDVLTDRSEHGRLNRVLALDLLRARMRFEAADARLVYYHPEEPRGFLDDHEEQGFHWVQTVLDHPAAGGRPRTARGHELVARQLTYRGAPLADVVLIGVRDPRSVSRVVLYTPNAPDGIAWREFADRAELTRRFLVDPAFEAYLLQRLPEEFALADDRGQRHFALPRLNGNRSASWVFDLDDCSACTAPDERFAEQEVTASVLDTLYDTAIGLAKRNAHHLARSTRLATVDAVARSLDLATGPFDDAGRLATRLALDTVLSIPRTAQAAWRFYDHVKAGDATAAFLDFVEGYTSALNVVPLPVQVPSLFAGSLVRASAGNGRLVTQRRPLPRPDTLFEDRFLAHGVSLPPGPSPASGVYAIGQARYIRHDGQLFHVRFDDASRGWRLSRPGALDARVSGPAIERLADGRWHFRHTGLRGGSGRVSVRADLYGGEDWEALRPRLAADIADFSHQEVLNLQAWLSRQLEPWDAELLFQTLGRQWDEGLARPMVGPARRALWDQAIGHVRAQRTPPPMALPGPSAGPVIVSPHLSAEAIEGLVRVPRSEWPAAVYYYAPVDDLARLQQAHARQLDPATLGEVELALPQTRVGEGTAQGLPVLAVTPWTRLDTVRGASEPWLPRSVDPAATLESASSGWVHINLRQQLPNGGQPHMNLELYRPAGAPGTAYVLRPTRFVQTLEGPNADIRLSTNFSISAPPKTP
ncbi:hypothetical protein L2Y94_01615 [Luteibacter aegosomatis]|uniref:DUF6543 domain-containing protein n=1 Tax=Luteibacter aegosomatis TaxID=2911537 RepID=UPI001FF76847|nr:DUF6543 domain-containing protein [Luteibacter aegosomatis]UPG86087.1 hypothetical protein L2Y94_01615 [Luteibacter aegosomatis]